MKVMPDGWSADFRIWAARLSPADLATLIDLVAAKVETRGLDGHGDLAARLSRLVDAFVADRRAAR